MGRLTSSYIAMDDYTVTAANIDESVSFLDIVNNLSGELLADKGLIGKDLKFELSEFLDMNLWTPKKKNRVKSELDKMKQHHFAKARRLVETFIAQLKAQFNIAKVWARNRWHLTNRVTRKILSHTLTIAANMALGRKNLQFQGLIP